MYRTNILHYYVKDFVRFSLLRRQSLRTGTASSDNSSGPSRCDAHTGGWRGSSYALNLRTEIFTQRGKRVNNSDRFADIQCGGYLSHSTISLPLPLFPSSSLCPVSLGHYPVLSFPAVHLCYLNTVFLSLFLEGFFCLLLLFWR